MSPQNLTNVYNNNPTLQGSYTLQQYLDLFNQGSYTPIQPTPTPTPTPTPPDQGIIGIDLNQMDRDNAQGGLQALDPYSRTKGPPLDPNSFLGKISNKVGDFKDSMMDKFSNTKIGEGITSASMKIPSIMGAIANTRNPLNPNASNYNPSLQGQIDMLGNTTGTKISGTYKDPFNKQLGFTDNLTNQAMIGRDPNSGLAKYGPGSVLSGQNVVSGFGTNDYEDQLQNYIDKMMTYSTLTTFQKAKVKRATQELEAAREKSQDRIDALNKQKKAAKEAGNAKKARNLQIAAAAKAQEISRAAARRQQEAIEADQSRTSSSTHGGYGSGTGGHDATGPNSGGGYNEGNFCFDPSTPIQMADGSTKEIKNIQLGDATKGGEVTGVFQFKASDEIHDYKGVTVAGSHYVKEDGKFIMVKDSPLSVKIDKIPVVYSLDTSGRRIFIKDIEFADYNGDGVAKNFLSNAGADLTGFDKEVLRQVENRLI